MRVIRRGAIGTLCALAAMLASASGSSPQQAVAAEWLPCAAAILPLDCANYTMPLDRTGAVPGTTTVRAIRVAASEGPRMGTLFVIAGGPGQTSMAMIDLMDEYFAGANRYDVIAVDQRGSGASEPLNCPRIESGNFDWDGTDPKTDRPLTDCSISLGPARSAYNTAEAVADLDAIRADLGVQTATFFGVSYGTKVALAYAKAHPDHTRALLLDSVLPTDMPGAFDTDSIAAMRRALNAICGGGRCRGIGARTVTNTARLAARLDRRPVETFNFTPTGRMTTAKIDGAALMGILFAADLDPFIYNQFPGMLTQALRGDTDQLTRLFSIVNDPGDFSVSKRPARATKPNAAARPAPERDAADLAEFSNTMYTATTCADLNPPWVRSNDLSGRQATIEAAAAAIPKAEFEPFSRRTAIEMSTAAFCRGWQQSAAPPAIAQGPLPDIPTLALSGSLDVRTPSSWAQRAVAGDPRAQLVQIANTGHSVIGSDPSGCALSLAKRFLIFGATDGRCRDTAPPIPIAPLPPAALGRVRMLPGRCRGMRGARCARARRQLAAAYLAMRDSLDQLLVGGSDSGPGLRGGFWDIDLDFDSDDDIMPVSLRMNDLSNVPGSLVSGSIEMSMLPRVFGTLRTGRLSVDVSGRIAYDRRNDALTLSGRRGRLRVRATVRPSRPLAPGAAVVTARALAFRRSYALAVPQAPRRLGR